MRLNSEKRNIWKWVYQVIYESSIIWYFGGWSSVGYDVNETICSECLRSHIRYNILLGLSLYNFTTHHVCMDLHFETGINKKQYIRRPNKTRTPTRQVDHLAHHFTTPYICPNGYPHRQWNQQNDRNKQENEGSPDAQISWQQNARKVTITKSHPMQTCIVSAV